MWVRTSSLAHSPEEKVNRLEQEALDEADHLPKEQQTPFKAMIRNAMAQIRSRIAEMRAQGRIDYEINKVVDGLLQDFHLSKANFIEQTAQYDINKGLVRNRNQSIRNRLLQCNADFRAIQLMDFDEEPLSLDQEPLQQTTTPTSKLEERKTQLARCIQMTMDPESILGAMPCVAKHSQGLTKSEQKELDAFVPKAIVGKTANDIAASFAMVSKAINAVVTPIFKAWALSALSEAVLAAEPHRYNERMAEMRRALSGGDPEFNKAMREMTPQWALQTAHYLSHANLRLAEFDRYMNQEYRTVPGLIHEGCIGGVDIGLMAVGGVAVKTFKQVALITGRGVLMGLEVTAQAALATSKPVYRAFEDIVRAAVTSSSGKIPRFITNEAGSFRLPQFFWPSRKLPKVVYTSEKRYATHVVNYKKMISNEEKVLKNLERKGLPKPLESTDVNGFNPSESIRHTVQNSKLKATLLLRVIDDTVIYTHRTVYQGERLIEKASGYTATQSLENILAELFDFARKKQLSKVVAIYDPSIHPLASVLEAGSIEITALGKQLSSKGKDLFVVGVSVPAQSSLSQTATQFGKLTPVTLKRELAWNDFGIAPEFFGTGSRRPPYSLKGSMVAKEDMLLVKLEEIRVPNLEGQVKLPALIHRFEEIARKEGVSLVHFRIDRFQEEFLKMMVASFGKPTDKKYASYIFEFPVRQRVLETLPMEGLAMEIGNKAKSLLNSLAIPKKKNLEEIKKLFKPSNETTKIILARQESNPPLILTEGQRIYRSSILDEQRILGSLRGTLQPVNSPVTNLLNFVERSRELSFRHMHLGPQKVGTLKATLLYQHTDDGMMFLIRSQVKNHSLIEATKLKAAERTRHIIDSIFLFAESQKARNVVIAYDSKFHAVAHTFVCHHSKQKWKVNGIGQLDAGTNINPLTLLTWERLPK